MKTLILSLTAALALPAMAAAQDHNHTASESDETP